MREALKSRIQYLRDCVLGLAIFVAVVFGGLVLADLIVWLLPLPHAYAHSLGLCIGMIPWWWLLMRLEFRIDWLDYIAIGLILLASVGLEEVFSLHLHAACTGLAMGCAYCLYSILRKRFGSRAGVPSTSPNQQGPAT